MLRMIGLMPIVRNHAFDMVSDGRDFKLWIPPRNRFVVGRNDIETHNTQQPLEICVRSIFTTRSFCGKLIPTMKLQSCRTTSKS